MGLTDHAVAMSGSTMGVSIAGILTLLAVDKVQGTHLVSACAFALAVPVLGWALLLVLSKVDRDQVYLHMVALLLVIGHCAAAVGLGALVWSISPVAGAIFLIVALVGFVTTFIMANRARKTS